MVKNKITKSLLDQGQLLSDNFLLKTNSKIQKSAVKEIDIESSKNTLLYSPYKTEVKLNLNSLLGNIFGRYILFE